MEEAPGTTGVRAERGDLTRIADLPGGSSRGTLVVEREYGRWRQCSIG